MHNGEVGYYGETRAVACRGHLVAVDNFVEFACRLEKLDNSLDSISFETQLLAFLIYFYKLRRRLVVSGLERIFMNVFSHTCSRDSF